MDERLDRALEILRKIAPLDTTTDQETLGLVGAVYKRRWEAFARKDDLERSLSFYLRGYEQGPNSRDPWYPGINAAYILDLLAVQEMPEHLPNAGGIPIAAQARLTKAREIREDIVQHLLQANTNDWWPLVASRRPS